MVNKYSNVNKKRIRKMGFTKDQEGIYWRYLRELENWDSHLQNTKKFILSCLNRSDYHSVAILGSGWLLDVPLDELTEKGKKIFLYDLRHPRQIKHALRNKLNVEFVEIDLTGGLVEYIYSVRKQSHQTSEEELLKNITHIKPPTIKGDIVISLNIMDQLDGLLIEYLKPWFNGSKEFWDTISRRIHENHIHLLRNHRSLLITDVNEILVDNNEITKKPLIFAKLPPAKNKKQWEWVFDTTGSYHKNKKTIFNVIALEL